MISSSQENNSPIPYNLDSWSDQEVELITVNTGQVLVVRDQSEWKTLMNNSNPKWLVVLDSEGRSVKQFGQSKTNYVILRGDFSNNSEEKEYQLQLKGFELFVSYVNYSVNKCENSIANLKNMLKEIENKNFIEQFQNFQIDQSFEVDFEKMVDEMQKKLESFCKMVRKTISDLENLLQDRITKSIQDLRLKEEKIQYFNQTVKDYIVMQMKHKPFEKMMDELYRELIVFDKFDEHYMSVLNEFSRRNNEGIRITQLKDRLSQVYQDEQEKRKENLRTIGVGAFNFVLKKIPQIQNYRAPVTEMVEMFSPTEVVTSDNVFNSASILTESCYSEDLKQSKQHGNAQFESLMSEIENLKREAENLKETIRKQKEENTFLKDNVQNINNQKECFENEVAEQKKTIEDLKNKMNEESNQLYHFKNQHVSLISDIEILRKDKEELKESMDQYQKDKEQLTECVQNITKEKDDLVQHFKKQIADCKVDYDDLLKKMDERVNSTKKQYELDIEHLTIEKEEYNNKMNEMCKQIEQIRRDREESVLLSKRIFFLEEENNMLTKKEIECHTLLDEQKKLFEDLEKENREANNQLTLYKQQCETFKIQVLSLKETIISDAEKSSNIINSLNEEIGIQKQNLLTVEKQNNQNYETVISLRDVSSKMYTEREFLEQELRESYESNTKLREGIEESEKKVLLLGIEILELKNQLQHSSQEKEQLLATIDLLNEDLSSLRRRMDDEQLSLSYVDSVSDQREKQILMNIISQLYIICYSVASVLKEDTNWIDVTLEKLTMLLSGETQNLTEDMLVDIVRGLCNRWYFSRLKNIINENGEDIR